MIVNNIPTTVIFSGRLINLPVAAATDDDATLANYENGVSITFATEIALE